MKAGALILAETALWILGFVAANMLLGAIVWASIDDDEQRLLEWFKDCPRWIAPIMQPLVLMAWPVGVWFWWRN